MNYLSVPDSSLKLVDGNIVMLERFPGIKWVLHNGWYNYNGRQYMGWYFSSIPSQTILPVSNQDLRMITLVSSKSNDSYPEYPAPPRPPVHPCPPPPPAPYDPPHDGGQVYPPIHPDPKPENPAFFSQAYKQQLEEAFISVPTIKKRDQLDTSSMPDGKIVRVNSVGGYPKYYVWSVFNDHWEELDFVFQEELEDKLSEYYTSTELNEQLSSIHDEIDELTASVDQISTSVDAIDATVSEKYTEVSEKIVELRERIDNIDPSSSPDLSELISRIEAIEGVLFNITEVDPVTGEHTVIVRYGDGLGDSNFMLGDDNIEETMETASDKTLATEKAVARKVEESLPRWEVL